MKTEKYQGVLSMPETKEWKYKGYSNVRVYQYSQTYDNNSNEVICISNISEPLNWELQKEEKRLPEGAQEMIQQNYYHATENLFTAYFAKQRLQFLEGKMLTLLEATIDNEQKLKATKDIVRGFFKDKQLELDELSRVNILETE